MQAITIQTKGSFKNLNSFLEKAKHVIRLSTLDKYGQMGVEALRNATPEDSGETADSWYYDIERGKEKTSITWGNYNVVDGVNIALIIQYGHATRNGSWVEGIDYINPALKPVFEDLARECWRDVDSELGGVDDGRFRYF